MERVPVKKRDDFYVKRWHSYNNSNNGTCVIDVCNWFVKLLKANNMVVIHFCSVLAGSEKVQLTFYVNDHSGLQLIRACFSKPRERNPDESFWLFSDLFVLCLFLYGSRYHTLFSL